MSNPSVRVLTVYYAHHLIDLYGMLALDTDLTPMQRTFIRRLQQIIRKAEPQADVEITFGNITRDLEQTFQRIGRQAFAEGEGGTE